MRNFLVMFGAALAAVVVRDKYLEHKYKVTMTTVPATESASNDDDVD